MEHVLTAPAPATATTLTQSRSSYRINSIDFLRGLVMVIMALDHTRDFFHAEAFTQDPLSMETTTPILFFTRWITHFCAPVFVFLAGTSGWFQALRKTKKELSLFLVTRGLWLILIEITVVGFSWTFDFDFGMIGLQTIWAIGISMVLLGLAIWLPFAAIFAIGSLIVLGHNSLDFYEAGRQEAFGIGYSLVHRPGFFQLSDNWNLLIMYPFLPWTGLMFLGYCFGKLFTSYEGAQRRKILTLLGAGVIIFFIALRAANIYGNPGEWQVQKNALYTFLSFIDTHKYPPSLLYMCMTIGPAILFLAWAGNMKSRFSKIITVYGRVPFFYYVLHFYLIHLLCTAFFFSRGHSWSEGVTNTNNGLPNFLIPGEGYSLWVVYGIWILVVAALYPVCKWFSEYKKTHKQWWVGYL